MADLVFRSTTRGGRDLDAKDAKEFGFQLG